MALLQLYMFDKLRDHYHETLMAGILFLLYLNSCNIYKPKDGRVEEVARSGVYNLGCSFLYVQL
jgi:hypothetical protein